MCSQPSHRAQHLRDSFPSRGDPGAARLFVSNAEPDNFGVASTAPSQVTHEMSSYLLPSVQSNKRSPFSFSPPRSIIVVVDVIIIVICASRTRTSYYHRSYLCFCSGIKEPKNDPWPPTRAPSDGDEATLRCGARRRSQRSRRRSRGRRLSAWRRDLHQVTLQRLPEPQPMGLRRHWPREDDEAASPDVRRIELSEGHDRM